MVHGIFKLPKLLMLMFQRKDKDGSNANVFQELVRRVAGGVELNAVDSPLPLFLQQVGAVSAHILWVMQQNNEKTTLDMPVTGKPNFISMLDKNETPTVWKGVGRVGSRLLTSSSCLKMTHGYSLSLAFGCLLDLAKSISSMVQVRLLDFLSFSSSSFFFLASLPPGRQRNRLGRGV